MIYVDTSVLLAFIFAEDRFPAPTFWAQQLISSRLLEYETWTRVHGRALPRTQYPTVQQILEQLSFVALAPQVLARVLEPFPVNVRTLDAIHLSTATYLRQYTDDVRVATYDERFARTAKALHFDVIEP